MVIGLNEYYSLIVKILFCFSRKKNLLTFKNITCKHILIKILINY